MLLAALLVLLLLHGGLTYIALHYNVWWILGIGWSMRMLLDQLLPANLAEPISSNWFMFIVGERFAAVLTLRFMALKTLKSPALLSCVALLVAYYFASPDATRYIFDQIRFQMNKSAYLAMARSDEGWPEFVVVNWGESGFLDSSMRYRLVFDRSGGMASGKIKPDSVVGKSEHMECNGTVSRLSSDFYSVAVFCEVTI